MRPGRASAQTCPDGSHKENPGCICQKPRCAGILVSQAAKVGWSLRTVTHLWTLGGGGGEARGLRQGRWWPPRSAVSGRLTRLTSKCERRRCQRSALVDTPTPKDRPLCSGRGRGREQGHAWSGGPGRTRLAGSGSAARSGGGRGPWPARLAAGRTVGSRQHSPLPRRR